LSPWPGPEVLVSKPCRPYVSRVMLTIRDAARIYGLSERAIRLRLDALRPQVDAYLRKGPNGQLILTDAARAMLDRLEALRKADGLTVNLAAARVKKELSDGHKEERQGASTSPDPWLMLVEELRAEVRRLEEENRWLRTHLEERLALPTPRRRWWWPFWKT